MKRLISLALIFALLLSLLGCQEIKDSDNTDNFNNEIPVRDTPMLSMLDIYGEVSRNSGNNDDVHIEYGCELYGDHKGYEVPDAKYLYIREVEDNEYLPIYGSQRYGGKELNEEEFNDFSTPLLKKAGQWFNIESSQYQDYSSENSFFIKSNFDGLTVRAIQSKYGNTFDFTKYRGDDATMELNGLPIEIDVKLSDEEIIASLGLAKAMFFDFFGVSFSDATLVRNFQNYGNLTCIKVSFHNEDDVYHPFEKNSFNEEMAFNFSFRYEYEKQDYYVSSVTVQYYKNRQKFDERYITLAQAKRIAIEDAVEFVRKRYMFSAEYGECSICWEKMNFAEYDFVEIQYTSFKFSDEVYLSIPYYVFYKKVPDEDVYRGLYGEDCKIYETVKVPAIEIIGYEEYFENQKYRVKISKESDTCIENEVKDYYAPGEEVIIKIKGVVNHSYDVYVNGERISATGFNTYKFIMPNKDVSVRIDDFEWFYVPSARPPSDK